MEIRAKFGTLVKKRRGELGLSQEDLAGLADLDRTYISGIERGVRNPTLTVLARLSEALDQKLAEMLKDL